MGTVEQARTRGKLSARYFVREAANQLKDDAEEIALSLKNTSMLTDRVIAERLINRTKLSLIGRSIESEIIVRGKNGRIVLHQFRQDRPYGEKKRLGVEIRSRLFGAAPGNSNGERREPLGEMTLAVRIRDVNGLSGVLRGAQWASALIGGLAAVAMGFALGRTITSPIRRLTRGIRGFSPRNGTPDFAIRSLDEIGELADSFVSMAANLQRNERKQTEFLQNASHELKTPLMAIQGNAEALKDGIVQGEEAGRSLDVIVSECQRLKGVVDELIYLTNLDQPNGGGLRLEQVRIGEVAGEALNRLQPLADREGIELRLEGVLEAEGTFDRDKLVRVFLNLVGNGIRYAQTTVRLEVAAKVGGRMLEVRCCDDGPGFAPGEEKRVFERFYKGQKGGTGIGLAIVKAIVEAHGGSVEAARGQPQGAVFTVRLPRGGG